MIAGLFIELVAAATLSFTGWTYNQRKTVEAEQLKEVRQMELSEQNQCHHKWKTIRTKEFVVKGKKVILTPAGIPIMTPSKWT